jgi:hypothetical protein
MELIYSEAASDRLEARKKKKSLRLQQENDISINNF